MHAGAWLLSGLLVAWRGRRALEARLRGVTSRLARRLAASEREYKAYQLRADALRYGTLGVQRVGALGALPALCGWEGPVMGCSAGFRV
jgi:hypothetical protein